MKSSIQSVATAFALAQAAEAVTLNTASTTSIKSAAKTISENLYAFHNASATTGQFNQPQPWFWWRSGAAWTALMDYQHYTNDTTYSADLVSSLKTNLGPKYDFADASQSGWEANDDQAYWLYNALTGMEYGFDPIDATHTWESIAQNVFAEYVTRWTQAETTCNGGLKWQYNPALSGYTYKNTVSNSGFFQTAARLARYTGNQTYADWANKIWDWSQGVGFVTTDYHVYDGAGEDQNCTAIDTNEWSYNIASYMHGAAHMYNLTEDATWEARVTGLVKTASEVFFQDGIMYEQQCEPDASCTIDNTGFKSSLARWMGKTAVLVPSQKATIMALLKTSAAGAGKSCAGTGNACGIKWTVGGFDGQSDFGTTLSAFEVIQSLLVFEGAAPLTADTDADSDSDSDSDAGTKVVDEPEPSTTPEPVKKTCGRKRA
ncbi:glycoside hydrolase [Xylariaceae sp. FL1272]|nr:glycoside hydrolase [Xylariaceae sp. FL1272]